MTKTNKYTSADIQNEVFTVMAPRVLHGLKCSWTNRHFLQLWLMKQPTVQRRSKLSFCMRYVGRKRQLGSPWVAQVWHMTTLSTLTSKNGTRLTSRADIQREHNHQLWRHLTTPVARHSHQLQRRHTTPVAQHSHQLQRRHTTLVAQRRDDKLSPSIN